METIIKKITDNEIENDKIIKTAAEIISRGGLVAFPTETVYGLGGDSLTRRRRKNICSQGKTVR